MTSTPVMSFDDPGRRADARRLSARRWQRTIRLGCLPVTLAVTLLILAALNLLPYVDEALNNAGVVDADSFARAQLAISLQSVFLLQMAFGWALGVAGATTATSAAAAQGRLIRLRLMALLGRARFLAWAMLSLRILFLLIAGIALVLIFTRWLSSVSLSMDLAAALGWAATYQTASFGLAVFVGMIVWLFGPFLRLRVSMALGALAATWSRRAAERVWLAITAQLGMDALGALALVWGGAMVNLVYYALQNPNVAQAYPYAAPSIASLWPATQGAGLWIGLTGLLTLHLAGQVALPPAFLAIASWRLARRQAASSLPSRRFAPQMPNPAIEPSP